MSKDSKKVYTGRALMENSRWQDVLDTFTSEELAGVEARVDELIADNGEYCDEKNYAHMCNMLVGLALYEMYQAQGLSKKDAYQKTAEPMWAFVEKGAGTYRKLLSKPGMIKMVGVIMPKLMESSSGYGWEYAWHKGTSKRALFECKSCIYAQILPKYDALEMGTMFCHADVINFGSIPGVKFTREHTLCSDGQPCDFLFTKE